MTATLINNVQTVLCLLVNCECLHSETVGVSAMVVKQTERYDLGVIASLLLAIYSPTDPDAALKAADFFQPLSIVR